jgi:hypothetical protein
VADAQRECDVVALLTGQLAQTLLGLADPVLHRVLMQHHRYWRDLAESHYPWRATRGQRDRLRGKSLLVRQAEPRDASGRVTLSWV